MSELKERPILFSAPMVRAILAGTKTQTRRIVKPQPPEDCAPIIVEEFNPTVIDRHGDEQPGAPIFGAYDLAGEWGVRCPYGKPGDRLWVREGFSGPHYREAFPPSLWYELDEIHYWADGNPVDGDWTRPRPSIHMPRWASRILLEVVAVSVERLQDITAEDCWAEGVPHSPDVDPVHEYMELWESINGAGSWSANPWVFVISFRRVE